MESKAAYTVAEVAAMTGFSRGTVTRMFERERGILMLNRPESMHKRRYRSRHLVSSERFTRLAWGKSYQSGDTVEDERIGRAVAGTMNPVRV